MALICLGLMLGREMWMCCYPTIYVMLNIAGSSVFILLFFFSISSCFLCSRWYRFHSSNQIEKLIIKVISFSCSVILNHQEHYPTLQIYLKIFITHFIKLCYHCIVFFLLLNFTLIKFTLIFFRSLTASHFSQFLFVLILFINWIKKKNTDLDLSIN